MSDPVDFVIDARPRDLGGGFKVRRVLPFHKRRMVGPFIFFDHFGPVDYPPGKGFDVRSHPHIGLATVTYLFEGAIAHRDTVGSHITIRPGAVNWMVAGRGIVHSERTPDEERAAGMRMSFLPTRVGLATDVMTRNPELRTVASPYDDGEVYVAMPALKLDAALLHVNVADRLGNTLERGRDRFFDHLFARAADASYVSCEQIEDHLALDAETAMDNRFERYLVKGVVPAPCGAHPTYMGPEYGWDMAHLKVYNASATEEDGWTGYFNHYIAPGEDAYLQAVGGVEHIRSLALPAF